MSTLVAHALAALALAFGVTALTTFSVRSETSKKLVVGSFVVSFALILAVLQVARLPRSLALPVGATGFFLGLVFSLALKIARELERRAGTRGTL